jgi:hypothetical protein
MLPEAELKAKQDIENKKKAFMIWDSMANTGTKAEKELPVGEKGKSRGDRAIKIAEFFRKYTVTLGMHQCTLLITNQLKDRVDGVNMFTTAEERFTTPGGRGARYNTSLHLRLTHRKAKDAYLVDANGFTLGSEVKAEIYKSRFGTYKRLCTFFLLWGGGSETRIWDEENWLRTIENSEFVKQVPVDDGVKRKKGAPKLTNIEIQMADGEVLIIPAETWHAELVNNEQLRQRVVELIKDEQITKFANRTGKAKSFYSLPGEKSDIDGFTDETNEEAPDEFSDNEA